MHHNTDQVPPATNLMAAQSAEYTDTEALAHTTTTEALADLAHTSQAHAPTEQEQDCIFEHSYNVNASKRSAAAAAQNPDLASRTGKRVSRICCSTPGPNGVKESLLWPDELWVHLKKEAPPIVNQFCANMQIGIQLNSRYSGGLACEQSCEFLEDSGKEAGLNFGDRGFLPGTGCDTNRACRLIGTETKSYLRPTDYFADINGLVTEATSRDLDEARIERHSYSKTQHVPQAGRSRPDT